MKSLRSLLPLTFSLLLVACGGPTVTQILTSPTVNDDKEIEAPSDLFTSTGETIHAHVFFEEIKEQTEVTGAWWYVPAEQKIFERQVFVTPEFPVAKFSLTNTTEWPAGPYKFVVTSGGKELSTKEVIMAQDVGETEL